MHADTLVPVLVSSMSQCLALLAFFTGRQPVLIVSFMSIVRGLTRLAHTPHTHTHTHTRTYTLFRKVHPY